MCPPLLALIPAAISSLSLAGAATGAAAAATPGIIGAASAGLGAISAVASYAGGISAHDAAKKAANLNYSQKLGAINQSNVQLSQEQSEDTASGAIKQAQSFGRIAASASSLGLGASTMTPFLNAALAGDARNTAVDLLNITGKRNELGNERYSAALERKSAIDAVPRPGISSLFLGLGKSALEGASTFAQVGGKFS